MQQLRLLLSSALIALACVPAFAQNACKYHGDLDPQYCDENRDLVADSPTDAKKLKNPGTIVFTYTPVEDPAVYEKVFKHFT
ncbi:MAG: phosphate/phosphite/phosphonate ABC transporter substrate-binding protein, partial [Betaproteobacteria bacterium]|nr:phosphate/phosphite/phosphonate ABC transporter substrate-binding protein [Betaproteobacteria bacterium]